MVAIRSVIIVSSAFTLVLGAALASAQNYPNKPIRILASPGNADVQARMIGQGITGPLGQPVIVENRTPTLIVDIVTKAAPDGYTLMIGGASFWIAPLLQTKFYDPLRDLAPITEATSSPDILVVNLSLPVNSIKELITLAKAKPGQLNYGSSGNASSSHLAGELFKSLAGVNIVRIAYKGSAQQIPAVISGEVQLTFTSLGSLLPSIKSGKVRALGVASVHPSSTLPEVPTIAASLPGFEPVASTLIFAPGKTPAPILNRLYQEMVRVLNQADVKEKLFSGGVDVIGSSPQQAMAVMRADIARMGKVIKEAGIKVE